MERNSVFFISKCLGDIIISYGEVYGYIPTRMDFTRMFVMPLDFVDTKNNETHVQGNDIQGGRGF